MADDLLAALGGQQRALAPARSVVLVVIDGLGTIALRAHAGHARTLSAAFGRRDVAQTVFPTTTAAALTSIVTGTWPGEHGLVGYRVRDPHGGAIVNQLTDWEDAGIDPLHWQAAPTVFERAAAEGRPTFALGPRAHAGTGFTRAVLRGAQFVPTDSPAQRVAQAYELAAEHPGALVYCYLPGVDKAGHRHGMASDQWIAALEEADAALSVRVPNGVGVLVTSDHGMVDVPATRHTILDDGDECFEGVERVGGEPRMLHLYFAPDANADEVTARWRRRLEGVADVATRAEALAGRLFGPQVSAAAQPRIGDALIVARGNRAIYDGRGADQSGQRMVGQHGALTPEETQVPYIRLGAFAIGA